MSTDPQTIAYPAPGARPSRHEPDAIAPHVIVLFGATGDLAKRKLLPGMAYLVQSALAPKIRVVGTSLEDMTDDEFRALAKEAVDSFGSHELTDEQWANFASRISYVPQGAGPEALASAVAAAEAELGSRCATAALSFGSAQGGAGGDHDAQGRRTGRPLPGCDGKAVRHGPGQCDRAQRLRPRDVPRAADLPHRPLPRQGGRPEHPGVPLRQRPLRADLEPQLHRPHPDRHTRDPRTGSAGQLLREHGCLQGHGGHPPVPGDGLRRHGAADGPRAPRDQRGEEQGLPLDVAHSLFGGGPRPVQRLSRGDGCGTGTPTPRRSSR